LAERQAASYPFDVLLLVRGEVQPRKDLDLAEGVG